MNKTLNQLILNKRTAMLAKRYLKQPAQTLLITGPTGSGKYALARGLAADLLELGRASELDAYPYFNHLVTPPGKQEIPIDSVREMIMSLKLKPSGTKSIRRVVVIENAHELSGEAQSALLKQLEEPPAATVFILTARSEHDILPTAASRAQKLAVHLPSKAQAMEYFSDKHQSADIGTAWYLSGGGFGLLSALLADDLSHPLKIAVEELKAILSQATYERILSLEQLGRDKKKLSLTLDAALRVLAALQISSVSSGNEAQAAKVLDSRNLVMRLQGQLSANSSPRLVALELALNLSL